MKNDININAQAEQNRIDTEKEVHDTIPQSFDLHNNSN